MAAMKFSSCETCTSGLNPHCAIYPAIDETRRGPSDEHNPGLRLSSMDLGTALFHSRDQRIRTLRDRHALVGQYQPEDLGRSE
jgi:hypothetical protein